MTKEKRLRDLLKSRPYKIEYHPGTITGRVYHDPNQLNIFEKEKPPCSQSAK